MILSFSVYCFRLPTDLVGMCALAQQGQGGGQHGVHVLARTVKATHFVHVLLAQRLVPSGLLQEQASKQD